MQPLYRVAHRLEKFGRIEVWRTKTRHCLRASPSQATAITPQVRSATIGRWVRVLSTASNVVSSNNWEAKGARQNQCRKQSGPGTVAGLIYLRILQPCPQIQFARSLAGWSRGSRRVGQEAVGGNTRFHRSRVHQSLGGSTPEDHSGKPCPACATPDQ